MANELAKMYMAYGKGRTIPVEQQEQEQTVGNPYTPPSVRFPMAGGYNLPQPKPTSTEQSLLAPTPVTPAPIVQPTVEQPQEQIQEAFKAESIESPITKQEEEKVLQDPVALRKYSKAGNMFARLGGFQEAPQELLATVTPQDLNIYNQQKLQARNQGIGEMLLMLSDAFGGRDIAMRALERQKAKQPAKVKATEAIKQEELAVLQRLKDLQGDIEKLSPYEKLIYDDFIRKENAESILSQILSGQFDGGSKQRSPIKITQIEEV